MPRSARIAFLAFVAAFLSIPSKSSAQIVGTPHPIGSIAVTDGVSRTGLDGNPVTFDSSINFSNGLTATAQAANGWSFSNVEQAVGLGGSLSVSGTPPTLEGGIAQLFVTSDMSGMELGPAPPDGVNYFYNIGGSSGVIHGNLAPGVTATVNLFCLDTAANGFTYDFAYNKTFTNNTQSHMDISGFFAFEGQFLGDWLSVRNNDSYIASFRSGLELTLYMPDQSPFADSSISIDPTFGAVETIQGVPEPSTLTLAGIAILCVVLYAWVHRVRPRGEVDRLPSPAALP